MPQSTSRREQRRQRVEQLLEQSRARRRALAQAAQPPPPSPPKPSMVRPYTAAGVRALGALLAIPGLKLGALAAGGSEALAQKIETPEGFAAPLDPRRIAVEAGIGAIPFAKVFKPGMAVAEALTRGAAYAGAGEALRETLGRGEEISPKAIATSAAIGGGVEIGRAHV